MKRLLGLLLVMGMVGCGRTVDESKLVERDGLAYEGDSETPFTGVSVKKDENGQKVMEWSYKDGRLDGPYTEWHENGQKAAEYTCKDGELYGGPWTRWRENGQKEAELVNKSGKTLSETRWYETEWYENGQKKSELFFNDGGFVSATMWDEEGNARFYDDYWNEITQ